MLGAARNRGAGTAAGTLACLALAPAGRSWAAALSAHVRETLGDVPEAEAIAETMSHRLAATTASSYGGHVANFVAWCLAQSDRPAYLPATSGTVLRWLQADVCRDNKVRTTSLQPYLSAINRMREDLDLPKPALGAMVTGWRRGLAHLQGADGREAQRVYLPAHVVASALDWALALDLSLAAPTQISAFRAAVAVVFTFSFFARGATGAALQVQHVRHSVAGLTITLEHEKGRARERYARVLTLPPDAVPGLKQLLSKWEGFWGFADPRRCYYALPGERAAVPSTQIDGWLREVLGHLDFAPPAGELWSGHSLRKGAASGASATGVGLDCICWCGGWSILWRAVHDCIDPMCPTSLAARRFFGWLRRPARPVGFGILGIPLPLSTV